jgi:hypothetical protein
MTQRLRARALPAAGICIALAACSAGSSAAPTAGLHDSPPAAAAVRDGIAEDLDEQVSTQVVFANWDPFVDPEGYPVVYEWRLGLSPGGAEVHDWIDVGGSTRASSTGLDLAPGSVAYVSVRASDLAGNRSAISTSDGVRVGDPAPIVQIGRDAGRSAAAPAPAATPTEGAFAAVERFGVTWTFDRPMPCGRFANGDWWVVGPVSITAIKPQSRMIDGRTKHGSMIDPDPRELRQGYDSAMFGGGDASRYDAGRNAGLGVGPDRPLVLAPGSSLITTTSLPDAGAMPQLETCAVLTCLPTAPPPDAFRPPYAGTDKTCRWRAAQLDLGRLARLPAPRGAPSLGDLAQRFERPWLDHLPGWTSRYLHPRANMPDYGREIADLVGQGALALQLDVPEARKRALAIAMTQVGIDLYGIVRAGGRFIADGGSGSGRKFPVLLAGALLGDADLLRCAREQRLAFAEDVQTFYVEETAPGVFNHGHGGYGPGDVGLAEWGNRHADDPRQDAKAWTSDPYRRCCTANAWHGFVLAARIMGLREAWGHDALFDYVDRYMQIEPAGSWTRSWSPFAERMWDRYRVEY